MGVAWLNAVNLHASVCLCLYEHTLLQYESQNKTDPKKNILEFSLLPFWKGK